MIAPALTIGTKIARRFRGGCWPLLSVLLALAVFGHDGLMTANAHLLAPPPAATRALADHARHLAPAHDANAAHINDPAAPSPTQECATVRFAAPPASSQRTVDDIAADTALEFVHGPVISVAGPIGPLEPTRPPDVRRALLQVYRI